MVRTKIIIITDAWSPQVNGVVTTYENIIQNLPEEYSADIIHPGLFKWFCIPFYKSIPWSRCSYDRMEHMLYMRKLDWNMQGYFVKFHIATEGPLGFKARRALTSLNYSYTSAYHTKFPEFIKEIIGIPAWMTKWYFNWFHKNSNVVLCSSGSSAEDNKQWNTAVVGRGYGSHFTFSDKALFDPVLLYVGRVSKEKNIDDFCRLEISGAKKIVVGDGPYRKKLEKLYPNVRFIGYRFGKELASCYQSADVCVFPSKVDTFGITILESMACGTPVAAYPVTGPIDQIVNGVNGYVSEDLEKAVIKCLTINRKQTAESVKHITWKESAKQFINCINR